MKLGKREPEADHRDLLFESYAPAKLPQPPSVYGWQGEIQAWGMLGNDQFGDCVFAGADHETMLWTKLGGRPARFTDSDALADYGAVTGFDPKDPSTDQGTNVRDALKYRQKTGIRDSADKRHNIGAYVALEPGNVAQLREAVYLFSAAGIGIRFPESAMAQFSAGKPWQVVAGAKVDGGHYVPVVGWNRRYLFCVTWGKVQPMTRTFYKRYCTTPNHRTLTADLRWVELGDVNVGDELMAFEEYPTRSHGRRYCSSVVVAADSVMADVVDVELSSGEVIRTTPEHRWLTMGDQAAKWVESARLRRRARGVVTSKVSRVIPPWSLRTDHDAGWFAGLLDGEGTLHWDRSGNAAEGGVQTGITFAQKEGVVLDRAFEILERLGYLRSVRVNHEARVLATGELSEPCMTVSISGSCAKRLALLGSVRPVRLLERFSPDNAGRMQKGERFEVVDVRPAGRQEIRRLTTTSRTLFVDGYPMHNCDEAWAILSEEQIRNGKSPAGFDVPALKADLSALRS